MIINDLDGYYIVFDTKNWNTELDTLLNNYYENIQIQTPTQSISLRFAFIPDVHVRSKQCVCW